MTQEKCKFCENGKCFIDDMTDKIDCSGLGKDAMYCGDYGAYMEENSKNDFQKTETVED